MILIQRFIEESFIKLHGMWINVHNMFSRIHEYKDNFELVLTSEIFLIIKCFYANFRIQYDAKLTLVDSIVFIENKISKI